MRPDRIPLFPLNVVLLPGGDLPLHIFEPRYREMVHRCWEQKSAFGMLLAVDDGVVRVGCSAEILEIVRRYSDGRLDIRTVGRSPFRVVDLYTQNPLLEGDIDYLDDRDMAPDPRTHRELIGLYEVCHTLVFNDYPKNIESKMEQFSYKVATTLPMDLLWKQQILELRSERDRQERLVAYLREWAPHLQKTGDLRRYAGGSRHVLN